MPYEGEVILTPGELAARGLMPPGPLAPLVQSTSPAANEAAIRTALNPPPQPPDANAMLKTGLQSGIAAGDRFFGGARKYVAGKLGTEELPGAAKVLSNALNPIPANTAQAAATLATLPIRGGLISGPLMRAGAAGAAGATVEGIQGKNPLAAFPKYALPQAVAEVPFTLARGIANQKAYNAAEAGRQQTSDFNQGFTKALEGADQAAYKGDVAAAKQAQLTARRTHAEQGAAKIAAAWDQNVPSWQGLPQSEAGLVDRIYGTGQQRLSDSFDKAMKTALADAKGKLVPLSLGDIQALHVEPKGMVVPPQQPGQRGVGMPTHANVDAAELIQAMTGRSGNARTAYRRAAEALDAAGIGDPKARAEYKSGQALIQFADASGMLRGGQFNPDAALKGLTTLKTVDQLRKRGEGTAVSGPLAEVTKDIPSKTVPPEAMPAPPQPRIAPPEPQLPEGFTVRTIPEVFKQHPWATASLGAGAGHLLGAAPATDAGLAGGALLAALGLGGRKIATEAPINPLLDILLRTGTADLGAGIRGSMSTGP